MVLHGLGWLWRKKPELLSKNRKGFRVEGLPWFSMILHGLGWLCRKKQELLSKSAKCLGLRV